MPRLAKNPLDLDVTEEGYDFNGSINTLETVMVIEANKTSERMATRYRDQVVRNILDQSLPLAPLDPKYKAYKARNNLDTRILISTGQMIDAIGVRKWRRGNITMIQVGINPNKQYKRESKGGHKGDVKGGKSKHTKIADVARWLEYGTAHMPPRPAWYLTLQQLQDQLKTFYDWYERQVRKNVRRRERANRIRPRKVTK